MEIGAMEKGEDGKIGGGKGEERKGKVGNRTGPRIIEHGYAYAVRRCLPVRTLSV